MLGSITIPILIWTNLVAAGAQPFTSPMNQFSRQMVQNGLHQRNLAEFTIIEPDAKTEEAAWDPLVKEMKICNLMGGLDLTRLRSFRTRTLFKDGIEDVELMREVVTESMYNGGLKGGLSDLEEMAATLDWKARGLDPNTTTHEAGLGWVDDRPNRRMERQVTTPNQPFVGDKQADAAFSDTLSNLLPWIRDRRAKEHHWYKEHQNGRTEGISKPDLDYDSLYIGVWIVTPGDAIWYYPPMSAYAHPYTFSDIVGGDYSWRVYPAEPLGWPFNHTVRGGNRKDAMYDDPYADVAHPGLSMISAMAPVYYTGSWHGYEYNDTFIGAVGVDVALDSIANVLDDLEDTLVKGSFALLADANTFKIVAVSQSVVDKIYPERTGFEEERVTYHDVDGSIIDDRRNQTYKVSDTIWQGLLDGVESADWHHLYEQVQATELGGRGYTELNLTVRGAEPAPYYAIFDRWDSVAEWVVLVFAPIQEVDDAIRPVFSAPSVNVEAIQGDEVEGSIELRNNGTLYIVVKAGRHSLVQLIAPQMWEEGVRISPGESVTVDFLVDTAMFGVGNTTAPVSFYVEDDDYPDCLHAGEISFKVSLRVSPEPDLNYLGGIRIAGLSLCAVVIMTAAGFVLWVIANRTERVVVASQPLFLVMIAMGCGIMASSIIPLSFDDSVTSYFGCDIACMATPWTASMGFVSIFSALFSKIYRVNQIFGQKKFKRIVVSEMDVLKHFFLLFSLNFIVLLCWTLIDPLKWVRIPLGEWDSYGACRAEGDLYIVFLSLAGAINLTALVLASYQAYRAREISDEFSETKYIAIAIGSMLQIALVGVPLLFLVNEYPSAQFFMEVAIIVIITMAVLLLIFVPKIIYLKNYSEIVRQKQEAKQKDIMWRASSHTPAGSSALSSQGDSGIMIVGYGTAALEQENTELKETVANLKYLLEKHDIPVQVGHEQNHQDEPLEASSN